MKNRILVLSCLLFSLSLFGQNLTFTDAELKRYLLTEACADTSFGSNNFIYPDMNMDGEIQLSEASLVQDLRIIDHVPSEFFVRSIDDLEQFSNLKRLSISFMDSLKAIDQPTFDSLHSLVLNDCLGMRILDVSNLPGLTEQLWIMGGNSLDYLNIQNGTVAQSFSMFYTLNTQYACVDSIAKEYNEMLNSGAMAFNVLPVVDSCLWLGLETESNPAEITIIPNPVSSELMVESNLPIEELQLYNAQGEVLISMLNEQHNIPVSHLPASMYFVRIKAGDKTFIQKVLKVE